MTRPRREKYWKLGEIDSRGNETWKCRNHPLLNDGRTEITFITNPESGYRELIFQQPHFYWERRCSRSHNRPAYILVDPTSGTEDRHYKSQGGKHREDGPAIIGYQTFGTKPDCPRIATYHYYLNDEQAAGPFGASFVKFIYGEKAGPDDKTVMLGDKHQTNDVEPNDPAQALTEKDVRHFRPKPYCP